MSSALFFLLLALFVQRGWQEFTAPAVVSARSSKDTRAGSTPANDADRGELGGDLNLLRQHWTPPQREGESNHYIDLWTDGTLPVLARMNGLTNNRALLVDSHGRGRSARRGETTYELFPHDSLLERPGTVSYFSASDLAAVLGPENAAAIHNIVLAGCNEEGRLRAQEFRRYFVNATNVTYMKAGELSFKPMYYQAIVTPSAEIKPLYGRIRRLSDGRVICQTFDEPTRGARPLANFIAELYRPGEAKPFRVRKAGRELLQPDAITRDQESPMLRADRAR